MTNQFILAGGNWSEETSGIWAYMCVFKVAMERRILKKSSFQFQQLFTQMILVRNVCPHTITIVQRPSQSVTCVCRANVHSSGAVSSLVHLVGGSLIDKTISLKFVSLV